MSHHGYVIEKNSIPADAKEQQSLPVPAGVQNQAKAQGNCFNHNIKVPLFTLHEHNNRWFQAQLTRAYI